jgi:hypothetical protein
MRNEGTLLYAMIDPVLASQTFATIVGLICNYKQENNTNQSFIQYLEQHRFDDIKNAIAGTQAIQDAVNQLLREDHAQILAKLNLINDVLTQVLSKVSGFEILAQRLGTGTTISPQALSILIVFFRSGAEQIALLDPPQLILTPCGGGIPISEPRFLKDDLNALESFGLIRLEYENGRPFYSLTRPGAEFAKNTNFEPPSDTVEVI